MKDYSDRKKPLIAQGLPFGNPFAGEQSSGYFM